MALVIQTLKNSMTYAVISGRIIEIECGETNFGKAKAKMQIIYGHKQRMLRNGGEVWDDLKIEVLIFGWRAEYAQNLRENDFVLITGEYMVRKYINKYTQKEAEWPYIVGDCLIVQEKSFSPNIARRRNRHNIEEEADDDDVYISDEFDDENKGKTLRRAKAAKENVAPIPAEEIPFLKDGEERRMNRRTYREPSLDDDEDDDGEEAAGTKRKGKRSTVKRQREKQSSKANCIDDGYGFE